jgi:hypothetical protein
MMSPSFVHGDPWHSSSYGLRRRQAELARRERSMMRTEERTREEAAEYERGRRRPDERSMAREEYHITPGGTMYSSERGGRGGETGRTTRRQQRAASVAGVTLPAGAIVRGPDGRLYRVVGPPRSEDAIPDGIAGKATKDNDQNAAEGDVIPDGKCDAASTNESTDDCSDDSQEISSRVHPDKTMPQKYASSPREEFLVEDVPYEEDDELRELRSVWRNRLPSPSQWIEPVESLCW